MQSKDKYLEDLVKSVEEDFAKRIDERREFERQWKLNVNYYVGNQYCEVYPTGEVGEEEKNYYWQSRAAFNHIAPIIDVRLAKLGKIRPAMSVRAAGGEEKDLKLAELSTEILNSVCSEMNFDKVVRKVTELSEIYGTAFYKIIWNADKGRSLGEKDGKKVKEGGVEVTAVSPLEFFPENLYADDLSEQKSVIHARAVNVEDIYKTYGVELIGEDVSSFSEYGESKFNVSYNGGFKEVKFAGVMHNAVMLIEKYELPSKDYKNGRLITVAGGKLLSLSDLPYLNGADGVRVLPFVMQKSLAKEGAFFGASVIERLIPVQRAYNAVKNRKHEFLNRLSVGVVAAEDGSIDADDLETDGLYPGKVIIYRQGSRPPQLFGVGQVPTDFTLEEERLLKEFSSLSGSSESARNVDLYSGNLSGNAIELLIEQDDEKLLTSAENVRSAVKETAKQVLRLFKQFAVDTRVIRVANDNKKVKLFYFKGSDISSEDVVFDTEYEAAKSPAQKKNNVIEMLKMGLLTDADGKLSARTKSKILEILGYGSLDSVQDITVLHKNKAERENIEMLKKEVPAESFDDHEAHIEEHLRKILSVEGKETEYKDRLVKHLNEHKTFIAKSAIISAGNLSEKNLNDKEDN